MGQILSSLLLLLIVAAGFAVMFGLWGATKRFFFKAGAFLVALMILPAMLLGVASGALASLGQALPTAMPVTHLPLAELATAYGAWLLGLGTCFGAARAVEASE